MSDFERITPDQVATAYKITGLTPVNNDWGFQTENKKCGCALTAISYLHNPKIDFNHLLEEMGDTEGQEIGDYPVAYIRGFIDGYDRDLESEFLTDNKVDYLLGLKDGDRSFKRMKEDGAFV